MCWERKVGSDIQPCGHGASLRIHVCMVKNTLLASAGVLVVAHLVCAVVVQRFLPCGVFLRRSPLLFPLTRCLSGCRVCGSLPFQGCARLLDRGAEDREASADGEAKEKEGLNFVVWSIFFHHLSRWCRDATNRLDLSAVSSPIAAFATRFCLRWRAGTVGR